MLKKLNKENSHFCSQDDLHYSPQYKGYDLILNSRYRNLINEELKKILNELFPDHSLLPYVFYHLRLDNSYQEKNITHSKRLRGILCLLISESIEGNIEFALHVASAIEFYHNASLILDDIEDGSEQRCGRAALWVELNKQNAINAAFLLKTAAELILLKNSFRNNYYSEVLKKLLAASVQMAEGQTRDLKAQDHWDEGLNYYFETTYLKTGILLGAACTLGTLNRISSAQTRKLHSFGIDLGIMHQIEDDIDDLLALKNKRQRKLDPGNIIYFIAHELGLLKKNSLHLRSLVELIEDKPSFWLKLKEIRKDVQEQLKESFNALQGISPKAKQELYEITRTLCFRNNSALAKILN